MSLKRNIVREILVVSGSQILVSAMLSLLIVMNEEVWTKIIYLP